MCRPNEERTALTRARNRAASCRENAGLDCERTRAKCAADTSQVTGECRPETLPRQCAAKNYPAASRFTGAIKQACGGKDSQS